MLQESGFIGNHGELLTCIKILSCINICKIRASNFASFDPHVSCNSSQRENFVIPDNKSCCTTERLHSYAISSYQSEMYRTY